MRKCYSLLIKLSTLQHHSSLHSLPALVMLPVATASFWSYSGELKKRIRWEVLEMELHNFQLSSCLVRRISEDAAAAPLSSQPHTQQI